MAGTTMTKQTLHTAIPNAGHQKVWTKTADYTADPDEVGGLISFNSTSNLNFTLPADADADFPIGDWFDVCRQNTGTVTFVAGSGAALVKGVSYEITGPSIKERYGIARVQKIAANTWLLSGNLTAEA